MKNNLIHKVLLFTFFVLLITSFSVLIDIDLEAKKEIQVLKRVKKAGKLVVGTSPDYPPYEFYLMGDEDSELVGLDIEIAKEIAKELEVKLEIKHVVFHELFKILQAGEVDLVIAGLAPTENRKKIVDFSSVYYQAIQNLLIRSEDYELIKSLKDLRGKKVGTQKGSIQTEMSRKYIAGAKFEERVTIKELIADLENNKLDAVIVEKPVAESYVFGNKSIRNIECNATAYDTKMGSAIAVKKGQTVFLNTINNILQKLNDNNKISEYLEDAILLMKKGGSNPQF